MPHGPLLVSSPYCCSLLGATWENRCCIFALSLLIKQIIVANNEKLVDFCRLGTRGNQVVMGFLALKAKYKYIRKGDLLCEHASSLLLLTT